MYDSTGCKYILRQNFHKHVVCFFFRGIIGIFLEKCPLFFKLCYLPFFFSEIMGYIDGIDAPRLVGDKQQYKFFKFYVNNGHGRRV